MVAEKQASLSPTCRNSGHNNCRGAVSSGSLRFPTSCRSTVSLSHACTIAKKESVFDATIGCERTSKSYSRCSPERSECPSDLPAATRSRTRCLSSLISGKRFSSARDQTVEPSRRISKTPPVPGIKVMPPSSASKVVSNSWAIQAARNSHRHWVQYSISIRGRAVIKAGDATYFNGRLGEVSIARGITFFSHRNRGCRVGSCSRQRRRGIYRSRFEPSFHQVLRYLRLARNLLGIARILVHNRWQTR